MHEMKSDLQVKRVAAGVRRLVLDHTIRNNGGYLSQACSSAEILSTLYVRAMNLGPSEGPDMPPEFQGSPGPANPGYQTGAAYNGPHLPQLDRLYFSPVHYALVLYSVLIETGRLAPGALSRFNQDGSTMELIGAEHSPGHEVTAGSLAQCLSQAAGAALARRLKGETGRNFVFMSDGEFQEGQTWEALAAAVHHRISNLVVYVDVNQQQCDGAMESVMPLGSLEAKLAAFGVRVLEVDGHDEEALAAAALRSDSPLPTVVLCRTDPCRGMDLLRARAPKLHYVRFTDPREREVFEELLQHLV